MDDLQDEVVGAEPQQFTRNRLRNQRATLSRKIPGSPKALQSGVAVEG
jgi:hypothetical protein